MKEMKITGTFTFKDGRKVVSGVTAWKDNVYHTLGQILVCGSKKWKVVAIDHFRQGCFGVPEHRFHGLRLEPIDHEEQPQVDDLLVSE